MIGYAHITPLPPPESHVPLFCSFFRSANVFWLNFQLILGGPFLPHIEQILRDKALSLTSPIVSASDCGNKSILRGYNNLHGQPFQSCDIILNIEKDIPLVRIYIPSFIQESSLQIF